MQIDEIHSSNEKQFLNKQHFIILMTRTVYLEYNIIE